MHVDVQRTIEQAKDAITVRRVYGDPFEKNGVTVIPAARVQGGAGEGREMHLKVRAAPPEAAWT
jgi:uncharacterized spore protein YtfJ